MVPDHNAFLTDIHDKLLAQAESDRAIMASIEHQNSLITLILWLVILGIVLQLLWIVIKIIIDYRQERRFKTLTEIAAKHGILTDLSKKEIDKKVNQLVNQSA